MKISRIRGIVSALVFVGITFAGARAIALQIMSAPAAANVKEKHRHEDQE